MCGIFGGFAFGNRGLGGDLAAAMGESLDHRGPDARGHMARENVVIGNRRLAILDLTGASNQPLYSHDERIVVVQNGEIYNFIELRAELESVGARFATSGDTEVILRAYETWGETFVTRLNGMFAIAIWDEREGILRLYRDRMGVKPLYWTGSRDQGRILFGSEIKSLIAGGLEARPNYDALAQFFALNYIPQPDTAFEGVSHLPPGHLARIGQSGMVIEPYWRLSETQVVADMTEAEAKSQLLMLLDDATRIRMRSDAAYGAFLSGGLDSSAVVGFMSLYAKQSVRTFSIGFDDPRFDESHFASLAARRFGTMHSSKMMEPEATALWPKMIWFCDQPHGDVSFMPMLQVSQLASQDVKMVLTGDGGDELFAGYEKYLDLFPNGSIEGLSDDWPSQYVKQSGLLQGDQPTEMLRGPLAEAFHGDDPYRSLSSRIVEAEGQDPINRVLLAETETLLPGNNLVKPDRMAMAHSLEVRSPFLDYRMAEFAFQVPGHLKLKNGETKWIYKRAVEPLLGPELTYRKKQMFTVPVGEWFRQSLTGYCREILFDGRLASRGIVSIELVERMLAEHISGIANHTRQIRALISVELWFRLFIDNDLNLRATALKQREL
ncbi:asparagine synthase (glutamine-hydrolyzing) [Altererythrobacter sp. MF3-039]|uniref:asparagine synthase (glutamine-hydrolyzing) n=1 Tax=Altererythrobacter sp. MF3-039 TaxID=3252901 RepID=UPI00390C5CC1